MWKMIVKWELDKKIKWAESYILFNLPIGNPRDNDFQSDKSAESKIISGVKTLNFGNFVKSTTKFQTSKIVSSS